MDTHRMSEAEARRHDRYENPGTPPSIAEMLADDLRTIAEALHDHAGQFTCDEADAVAHLFHLADDHRGAAAFLAAHTDADEPGDRHHDDAFAERARFSIRWAVGEKGDPETITGLDLWTVITECDDLAAGNAWRLSDDHHDALMALTVGESYAVADPACTITRRA